MATTHTFHFTFEAEAFEMAHLLGPLPLGTASNCK